ncbi:MAG: flagellar protein FlgN [Rhizobiales bacterium]|nr:flagellar protein FlgN [Hyphomicrobiales bacterium]
MEEETEALRAHRHVDLDELNRRKSRSLLELTRLSRSLPSAPEARLKARLQALSVKLAENRDVLALHLGAVREISDLLVAALGEAESDGTYGMPAGRGNSP